MYFRSNVYSGSSSFDNALACNNSQTNTGLANVKALWTLDLKIKNYENK